MDFRFNIRAALFDNPSNSAAHADYLIAPPLHHHINILLDHVESSHVIG